MAVKKITKRWLFNSFGVIVFILLAITAAVSAGVFSYYIESVRQAINVRVDAVNLVFSGYARDSAAAFSDQAQNYVQTFADRNQMEMMIIDSSGSVTITSSGFNPSEAMSMPDYEQAISSPDGYGEYRGSMGNEQIMAITMIPSVSDASVAAVRFVVSMENVYGQIRIVILSILFAVSAIIFFVLISSLFFINSIVHPIGKVGDTARLIAQGDFEAKIQKETDDEIGELCDIINYMADELAATEKLKNDFISSVSHELRTPLTAIKGWAETLQSDDLNDRDTLKKGMKVIISESERLSQMVEELLDFSRMQSGRLRLVMAKIDILAELGDAVLMFTERASREGIALLYAEPDRIITVYGDKNKLRQVFINIIDNALKYSDNGDTIKVDVLPAKDNLVRITVSDTGIGISDKDLPQIKTKFYKVATARRGSGIGLAVADEIITRHGGALDISSVLGEGTTVTITLPLYNKQDDMTYIEVQDPPKTGEPPQME